MACLHDGLRDRHDPRRRNDLKSHDRLVAEAERMIPKIAAAGLPTSSPLRNDRGLTDTQGAENCVAGSNVSHNWQRCTR